MLFSSVWPTGATELAPGSVPVAADLVAQAEELAESRQPHSSGLCPPGMTSWRMRRGSWKNAEVVFLVRTFVQDFQQSWHITR
jgi:hypothetical protein